MASIRPCGRLARDFVDVDVFQCITRGRHPDHPPKRNGSTTVGALGENPFHRAIALAPSYFRIFSRSLCLVSVEGRKFATAGLPEDLHHQQLADGKLDDRDRLKADLVPTHIQNFANEGVDHMNVSPKQKGQQKDRFLFLGSGLILMIIVLAGFAKAQRWGTHFFHIYINARDVNGLNKGEQIRIAGIDAGQVGTMTLNDQGIVRVKLKIEANKLHLIGPSSQASLAKEGWISESYLVITTDPRPREQAEEMKGRTINYEEPISVNTLLENLSNTQQQLTTTLRNTNALTAKDGSINTAFNATRQLAESLQKEVTATAPLVRDSVNSVAKDIHFVSESTEALEQNTRSLIENTQPLVVETLKDADQLTRSSQELVKILRNLFDTWLEPVDGQANDLEKQDSISK